METTGFTLEFFVNDLSVSTKFYRDVLDFKVIRKEEDGFTVLKNGDIRIDLQPASDLPEDHPARIEPGIQAGKGNEIVLEVKDIKTAYQKIVNGGWPLKHDLQDRPWGVKDFRLLDPDGRYIRITEKLKK